MGAFLSTPVTEKISDNGENEELVCGGSSMQGWRTTQEDAHNCLLNFDQKTSLFAVYDGHGGADVAIYSSLHLPDAIKQTESYAKGDYTQALKDAFLEFDAQLTADNVVKELEKIAQNHNGEAIEDKDNEEEDENESIDLRKEAQMPLADIIARYKRDVIAKDANDSKKEEGFPASPFLRAKKSGGEAGASSSSSSSFDTPGCSSSFSNSVEDSEVSSSSGGASSSKVESNSEACASTSAIVSSSATPASTVASSSNNDPDSSSSSSNICSASVPVKKETAQKVMVNGIGDSVTSSQNGSGKSEGVEAKGSASAGGEVTADSGAKSSKTNSDNVISSSDSSKTSNKPEKKRISPTRVSKELYKKLLSTQENGIDSSESDEDDETFMGNHVDSDDDGDDDEGVEDEEGEEEEDDGEDDEDEDDEDEDEEDSEDLDDEENEDDAICFSGKEKVGEDSGCTAVVALVHNDTLYVANAGDSRCVVSRRREAIEMSLDHKPEDPPEEARIVNAGGKVTADGRVNGGLNLSRALGDHSYKQNKSLGPTEQMISALPDVKTLKIDRSKDEFMVLACDGIWNSMTSQEVVNFIGERLDKGVTKLSDICEELFDCCLAPNTAGDGTGCDNMTCIIVRWKKPSDSGSNEVKSESEKSKESSVDESKKTGLTETKSECEKRCLSPESDESASRKKPKVEEGASN